MSKTSFAVLENEVESKIKGQDDTEKEDGCKNKKKHGKVLLKSGPTFDRTTKFDRIIY